MITGPQCKPLHCYECVQIAEEIILTTTQSMIALHTDGIVVVQLMTAAETAVHRAAVLAAVKAAPEANALAGVSTQTLGAFGALGTPSSQNNPAVRELRKLAHIRTVKSVWHTIAGRRNLEQLVDRTCIRTTKQPKESWHRDETPFAPKDDEIFGGWINLGEQSNYFSCAKGTHTEPRGTGGFAKIVDSAPFDARRTKVEVPPGCIIIFYEHLAHEVCSAAVKTLDVRLFVGWRLTAKEKPLIPDIAKRLDEQGTITIKSGQECPMYAALHWTNWRKKLAEFSTQFRPECKTIRTVASGAHAGERLCVVYRFMPSLKAMGLPLFPAYTEEEKALHSPGSSWIIDGETIQLHS
jgi:hypothetical protein